MGLVLERSCSLLHHCGESGAQVTFSSTLPVEGTNIRRNRWAESINTWLVSLPAFWGFWQCNGLCSTRHASIRWDSSFSAREESLCSGSSSLAELYTRCDGGGVQYQACPWQTGMRCKGQRDKVLAKVLYRSQLCWPHWSTLQSYGDDPGTHLVAEANRKTPRKHVKEIKEYSLGKDWVCNDTRHRNLQYQHWPLLK